MASKLRLFLAAALLVLGVSPGLAQSGTPVFKEQVIISKNTADNRPVIKSGQTAGAPQNASWAAGSMTIPYNSGADFGNTTPVFAQYLIRCSSIDGPRKYESCWNLDFYNNTGAAKPWPGANRSVAAGTYVQVNGGPQYRAAAAGTTGSSEPVWPASGSVQDGSVSWVFQDAGFSAAKSGMSLTSYSKSGGGNHWLFNPNCIIENGYANQLYCTELDVGNFSGFDWTVGSKTPGVVALWIGGVTQNTGEAAVMVGSQESVQGKPAWYFGYWCNNALSAGQGCFEDWSNSVAGYHTPSFAVKGFDIWLQSKAINALYINGNYSGAAIDTQGATIAANGHMLVMAAGQDICYAGGNSCWFWEASSGRMKFKRDGAIVFSIDTNGTVRSKGGFVTDANP